MNIDNKRNEHMKGAYAKYWIKARSDRYGFMPYDQSLIDLIQKLCQEKPKKLLEVGIGTGWPIAATLSQKGQKVFGIDIASTLIQKCNDDWPSIKAEVADAASLKYQDNYFELTYCAHVSWFLPNLAKSIEEMCRVTSDQGSILIDVMNINNPSIKKANNQHVFENTNFLGKIYKTAKNIVKLILQRGIQDWPFLVSQVPSNPNAIIAILSEFGGSGFKLYGWQEESLKKLSVSNQDGYEDFDRVVICCRVQKV